MWRNTCRNESWRCVKVVVGAVKEGGGAVIDRPGLLTKDGRDGPQTENSGRGAVDTAGGGAGGGKFRVLLLDWPTHTESSVVNGITAVIPAVDKAHAANCYHTSKTLGAAIVTVVLLELAELYMQELYRRGIRVTVEPDGAII